MKFEKTTTFLSILLIILTSGTVLYGQIYYRETLMLLLIWNIILFVKLFFNYYQINIKHFLLLLLLIIVIISNMMFAGNYQVFSYLALITKIVSVFLIICNINKQLAVKFYIHIMGFICIVSLPFYILGLTNPEIIRSSIESQDVWGHSLRVTPLYIYQDWFMNRNSGVYWEPGAFQAFINLALLCTFRINFNKRKQLFYSILFIVTLITTFSTTGFIVCLLVILSQIKFDKNMVPKLLFTMIVMISLTVVETISGVVSNKFNINSESYASFTRRMYDLNVALELIGQKPIIGWGLNNTSMYENYIYNSSSNSLLILGSQLGIIFLLCYLFFYAYRIQQCTKTILETITLFIATILIFSTENLILQPLFLTLLFGNPNFIKRKIWFKLGGYNENTG